MGSDTHDAQSSARSGTRFSGFAEEIDPAVRLIHAAGAIAQDPFAPDAAFEPVEEVVEAPRVGKAVSHEDGR